MDILLLTAACTAVLALTGCGKNADALQITVQHVPKEQPVPDSSDAASAGAPGASMPGTSSAGASAPSMGAIPGMTEFTAATPTPKWSPPADWVAQPDNPNRKATWMLPPPAGATNAQPAELFVSVFQGQLGGLLGNVNRWRGQVGLSSDLTEDRLGESVQNITIDGRPAQLVSLDGPDGKSLEGLFVSRPDRVWTFHLLGSTVTVAGQRVAFRAFLDSVKWQD